MKNKEALIIGLLWLSVLIISHLLYNPTTDTEIVVLSYTEQVYKKVHKDIKNVLNIQIVPTTNDTGKYIVTLHFKSTGGLNKKQTRTFLYTKIKWIMQTLHDDKISIYVLCPYLELTDQYGISQLKQVGKIMLDRQLANKINWDGILNEALGTLLSIEAKGWIHPVINQ